MYEIWEYRTMLRVYQDLHSAENAIVKAQKLWRKLPTDERTTVYYVVRNRKTGNIVAIVAGVNLANVMIVCDD